ncbi:hypothetical protein ASZ90_019535 [hydrocarbon metagenome]|uniref:Uncharacterized protein n=1 Tax=hydrocarbon metagenome TaxID=938273 RepID=A0A0W8E366_9ZZZZ
MPDRFINVPKPRIIAKEIIHLDKVDSTNEYIKRALKGGEIAAGNQGRHCFPGQTAVRYRYRYGDNKYRGR